MRKIKNIVAIATVAVMAFSMAGCKMIEKTPAAIQKTVLAKVGNEKITMADVNSELKSARKSVLEQLVNDKVLITKGTELGYVLSGDELNAAIEKERQKFVEAYGGEDKLQEAIKYYGMDDDKFNKFLENLVKTNEVTEAITKDVTVTDEDVEKYYNENIDKYKKKAGANAKHILFKTEEEAKAAKDKINSGEATFDDIYAEYEANATSRTFPLSEDLGDVENEQENFDTDFLAGFKQLKEGEISAPVKSSFGYHIIKVEGVQAEDTTTPLDEVKDSIKSTLETDKKKEVYNSTLEQWKKDLKVKTYENRL